MSKYGAESPPDWLIEDPPCDLCGGDPAACDCYEESKMKEIVLTTPSPVAQWVDGKLEYYEVVSVRNSTEWSPGQKIHRGHVEKLCRKSGWDVHVK